MLRNRILVVWIYSLFVLAHSAFGLAEDLAPQDRALQEYFEDQTAQVEKSTIKLLSTDYPAHQEEYRAELAEMLGLSPLPERTDLKATITGELVYDDIVIKKLHYQASPGLYVTANLYVPKEQTEPLPAILYVCGHSRNVEGDVSYGNKAGYHHHGVWFARNGYVCLMIDTIQLGEFQGVHHGTYRMGMWWWNARGYTPAGVEAWNGIRGIDYLQSLPEVDPERIGVTGRSGGGAYSWWVAALDTRVKAAVPVAGITSMRNHIVDGCISGHCDCMFQVNSQQWDYAMVSALVAPRPLLLTNTDKDTIFPLDGVMDVFWKTRSVYEQFGAEKNLGLAISEGPHKDTQRLQVNAFEWFDRFLKQRDEQALPAEKIATPSELRVFEELPADEITSHAHDTFVKAAEVPLPKSLVEWKKMRGKWSQQLRKYCFAAWPEQGAASAPTPVKSDESWPENVEDYTFQSQAHVPLRFLVQEAANLDRNKPVSCELQIVEDAESEREALTGELEPQTIRVVFAPRGLGRDAWTGDEKALTHIRRRFALLGQSLDAMRVYDIKSLGHQLRTAMPYEVKKLTGVASNQSAGNLLYASLFSDQPFDQLQLTHLPKSHMDGPVYLNVLKFLDLPQALAVAAEGTTITLQETDPVVLEYLQDLSKIEGIRVQPVTCNGQQVTQLNPAQQSEHLSEAVVDMWNQTMGGMQFWSDLHFLAQYRIQQNVFTQQCRLLDRKNKRYASGSFAECLAALDKLRIEENLQPATGEVVILLHGIVRSAHSFDPMQKQLEQEGYYVCNVNYPSTQITIQQAAENLNRVISSLSEASTIHLVGHSMGGLVIRAWFGLEQSQEVRETRIGKVVMMGTPNHGAEMADFFAKFPPYQWVMGQAGQQLRTTDETIRSLPIPTVPFGIIAGARGTQSKGYNPLLEGDDDGTVTVASTHLEGATDFYTYPALHMFLMRDQRSIDAVSHFLRKGTFLSEQSSLGQ